MSAIFHELLEASIGYLDALKKQGTRFVSVDPATLEGLANLRAPVATPLSAEPAGRTNLAPDASAPPIPAPPAPPDSELAAASKPMTADPAPTHSTPSAAAPSASGLLTDGVTPLTGRAKADAMAALRERASVCMKCANLAGSRKNVVFGVGSIDAELMFVGEAPGADEDAAGEPFVGKAGQLLNRIVETMGLTRDQVYIANILKCRPDTPGQSSGNRKPTPDEMKTCSPYLHAQIDLIRPKVLVALGATALEGLLGNVGGITGLRGAWKEYRGTPLMPTYHPAYLLYNQALREKRRVWEDMMKVMEKLGLETTDKHRGYFLPK